MSVKECQKSNFQGKFPAVYCWSLSELSLGMYKVVALEFLCYKAECCDLIT